MDDYVRVINEVGFPIAASAALGFFIWKLIMRIIDGMEGKVDVLEEKVASQIAEMEARLDVKIGAQHGILVSLIDRVRSVDNQIIRQDVLLKTLIGKAELIDLDLLAKAARDDQRKD